MSSFIGYTKIQSRIRRYCQSLISQMTKVGFILSESLILFLFS